ncbi:hypothetical protein ILYODFUR_011283 [Ilyodon furcidens]|uniref:Uncharacterized protein n=1 Tax=Ilyodon furcidens TaxID=33524 RepID=A0ABV0UQZ2_9TELE
MSREKREDMKSSQGRNRNPDGCTVNHQPLYIEDTPGTRCRSVLLFFFQLSLTFTNLTKPVCIKPFIVHNNRNQIIFSSKLGAQNVCVWMYVCVCVRVCIQADFAHVDIMSQL